MELIAEVWHRATAVQPPPAPIVVALAAAIAAGLVLPRAIWPYTRMLITITHEGAHGVAAFVTGRRLEGIRLHSDTSGLTVSSGRPSGPGMVTMLMAGYLGPAVVGLGAVGLLLAGHSLGLLWLFVILLALLLLQIRNFYGFVVVVGCALVLILVSWYFPAPDAVRAGVRADLDLLARGTETGTGTDQSTSARARRTIRCRPAGPADPPAGEPLGKRFSGHQLRWSGARCSHCCSRLWPSLAKASRSSSRPSETRLNTTRLLSEIGQEPC